MVTQKHTKTNIQKPFGKKTSLRRSLLRLRIGATTCRPDGRRDRSPRRRGRLSLGPKRGRHSQAQRQPVGKPSIEAQASHTDRKGLSKVNPNDGQMQNQNAGKMPKNWGHVSFLSTKRMACPVLAPLPAQQ